jgi:DNA-directed RNA polymerase beta' subunit
MHKCLAVERISLEILLSGIKDHIILPNEISETDRDQLLTILEDAIFCTATTDTSKLARNIKLHYYASSIHQREWLSDIDLKTDFCNFVNNIFNNTQLTDYLDTLNVNVDDLKASIYKKIQNTESEELYKYFMWNEPNSSYKGSPVT